MPTEQIFDDSKSRCTDSLVTVQTPGNQLYGFDWVERVCRDCERASD